MNRLAAVAVAHNFQTPLPLADALAQLGFVQADPIRSPARAQDLILRQRVAGYRAGSLEASYPSLDCEEDFLYAYGFLSRSVWRLVHPRRSGRLTALDRRVIDAVTKLGEAHPAAVATQLGRRPTMNAWGGHSSETTHTLQRLHALGLLRVARRHQGTRVYTLTRAIESDAPPPLLEAARLRNLVLLVARIFAPCPEPSLRQVLSHLSYCHVPSARTRPVLAALLASGELARETVDGVPYVWPADLTIGQQEAPPRVRILAPFDPLVWDRRRFEHLWGWPYRFEAYTPAPKRKLGYYAMPLLWRDRVIGWANVTLHAGRLAVETGFATTRPRSREFRAAFDAEIASLAKSLGAVL